jgi:hypothetical protein
MSVQEKMRAVGDAQADAIGLVRAVADRDSERLVTIADLNLEREHAIFMMASLAELAHTAYTTKPDGQPFAQWLDTQLETIKEADHE